MSDRCEPPAHLRGVDGEHHIYYHPVGTIVRGNPVVARWGARYQGWWADHLELRGHDAAMVASMGWRYLAPVVPPAEVDALRAEASEWCQKAQLFEGRIHTLRAELAAVRGALKDATAHLFGAAAAYRKYGRQHKVRGPADPFYTTRANDFDRAAERARAATREPLLAALGDTP